jgi:hypothetical protein
VDRVLLWTDAPALGPAEPRGGSPS